MPFDSDEEYTEFPARTIGGPTGDYVLTCDATSCEWAEFIICSIANGSGGASTVFVSGNSKAPSLKFDGTVTLADKNEARGYAFSLATNTSQPDPMQLWERITNSEKKVFIRIDAANNTSCYVTVRFRIKKLTIVPDRAVTTHPDSMQQLNIARADAIRQRLGLEKEIETEEATITANPARTHSMKEWMNGQR